jgi:hypothetical protein
MKISVSHQRIGLGNDLSISVEGDDAKAAAITLVRILYDGFLIGNDVPSPPVTKYSRDFVQQGDGGPGMAHTLQVSAYDRDGKLGAIESKWEDRI